MSICMKCNVIHKYDTLSKCHNAPIQRGPKRREFFSLGKKVIEAINQVKQSKKAKFTNRDLAFDPLDHQHCKLFILYFYQNLKFSNNESIIQLNPNDSSVFEFYGPRWTNKSTLKCKLEKYEEGELPSLNAINQLEIDDDSNATKNESTSEKKPEIIIEE